MTYSYSNDGELFYDEFTSIEETLEEVKDMVDYKISRQLERMGKKWVI